MLLILLTAEDCSNHYSESQLAEQSEMVLFDQLQNNFMADELDAESLQALELRATQKFFELVEYMNLYSDSSLNTQFRNQLKQLIQDAFISEQDLQSFFTELNLKEDSNNLLLSSSDGNVIHAHVESVIPTTGFDLTSQGNYKIELLYRFSSKGEITQGKIQTVAKKIPKKFGKNTLDVWKLFFIPITL